MPGSADRRDAIAFRLHAQGLDRATDSCDAGDLAVLDLGVQGSGNDAAGWSLANRGARVSGSSAVEQAPDLALAWTIRGAPHYYRRSELADVQVAVSPYSDADAGKRLYDANRPLKAAGITARQALTEIAIQMRELVSEPMVKGELSGALAARMGSPYLRDCAPCQATHLYEMPFRLAALHAGLELERGASPPVLHRISNWPDRRIGPAESPDAAPAALQLIRGCLRLLGPATPAEVAGCLDAPVAEIKLRWPSDAVEITVDGARAWGLDPGLPSAPNIDSVVRLLGPFDPFLQARDRHRLVPDIAHAKQLWPVLGRPGALLAGTEIVGVWRPKAMGTKFSVRLEPWQPLSKSVREEVAVQAARLADFRGLAFHGVI